MEAIHRLSLDRLNEDSGSYSSTLLTELRSLRQRKNELETRMQSLQESKKGLMVQLETLMKLLRVRISFFFLLVYLHKIRFFSSECGTV